MCNESSKLIRSKYQLIPDNHHLCNRTTVCISYHINKITMSLRDICCLTVCCMINAAEYHAVIVFEHISALSFQFEPSTHELYAPIQWKSRKINTTQKSKYYSSCCGINIFLMQPQKQTMPWTARPDKAQQQISQLVMPWMVFYGGHLKLGANSSLTGWWICRKIYGSRQWRWPIGTAAVSYSRHHYICPN